MIARIFKPFNWQHLVWNADGTRPWGRIAGTFLLLFGLQSLGIAASAWALQLNANLAPHIVGATIADLLIVGGALFFVPEPKK